MDKPNTIADRDNGFITFLLVSRLHIVAIAAMGTLTFGWLFTGIQTWTLPVIAAVDWFLVNLVNRVVDLPEDAANDISGTDWVARYKGALLVVSISILAASFVAVQFLEPRIWPLRVAYHLLGFAYNYPLVPLGGGRRIRLKEIYLVKNSASALGFMITVFGYPLVAAGGGVHVGPEYIWTMATFFFFSELSYEVVYDLRDIQGDRRAGVPTFPVMHGIEVTRSIVYGLLAISALALITGYAMAWIDWRAFVMIIGLAVQLAAYQRFRRRGVTASNCIVLTLLGAGLLLAYNAWVWSGLPLDPFAG
ncbi:MAG: UbiA family prenyltransferase [Deltaproteobacteria bacterium]|nr:UbiA family prenyltransferase [Deltaproteobacteria bacterium]